MDSSRRLAMLRIQEIRKLRDEAKRRKKEQSMSTHMMHFFGNGSSDKSTSRPSAAASSTALAPYVEDDSSSSDSDVLYERPLAVHANPSFDTLCDDLGDASFLDMPVTIAPLESEKPPDTIAIQPDTMQINALMAMGEILYVQAKSLAAQRKITNFHACLGRLTDCFLHVATHCARSITWERRAFWTFDLSILWCALINMGVSLVPMDLFAWIRGRQLPFFAVISDISKAGAVAVWEAIGGPSKSDLVVIPCVDDIELCAKMIVESGFSLRPFNVEGLIDRLVVETALPDVRSLAVKVLRLVETSSAKAPIDEATQKNRKRANERYVFAPLFNDYHPFIVAASCVFIICKLSSDALEQWAKLHYATLRGMRQDEVSDEHGQVSLTHAIAPPMLSSHQPLRRTISRQWLHIDKKSRFPVSRNAASVLGTERLPRMTFEEKRMMMGNLRSMMGGCANYEVPPYAYDPPALGVLQNSCLRMDADAMTHDRRYLAVLTALATLLGCNERVIHQCSAALEIFLDDTVRDTRSNT